ncbi:flippase [Nitrospira sp. T9]|uniref:flippase n=1 Tax=unclassified Nitrospira TaxID=2652172 RepID=UPI003F99BAE8
MAFDRSLVLNTAKYSLSTVSHVFLFVLFLLAARTLGPSDFGIFSFALAFIVFFEPIIDPGFHTLIIRDVARQRLQASNYLSHILAWKLSLALPYLLLPTLIAYFLHESITVVHAVFAMAVAGLFKSVKESFMSILKAYEYFGLAATSITVERLSLLVFGAFTILTEQGLIFLCWTFVIVRFADLVVAAGIVGWKTSPFRLGRNISFCFSLVRKALPLGVIAFLWRLYAEVDTVMLSAMTTDEEVGWYNASYKLFEGLCVFAIVLTTVLQPRLSRLFYEDSAAFDQLQTTSLKWVALSASLISANGWLMADRLIHTLYGVAYEKSIISFEIMLIAIFFLYCSALLQAVTIAMNCDKILLSIAVIGLLTNFFLNLLLISLYGYIGASIATVIANFIVFLCLLLFIHSRTHEIGILGTISKCVSIVVLCFALVKFFVPSHSLILSLVLMNSGILCLLYLSHFVTKHEIHLAANLLKLGNNA